jgi:hypothetical protein
MHVAVGDGESTHPIGSHERRPNEVAVTTSGNTVVNFEAISEGG